MEEELLRTKPTTTKAIINFNKDPFTDDSAEQVIYTISGTNNERKRYTSQTGFQELFGKILVGALMNEKGQIVLYFEENTAQQQADIIKNLVNEAQKISAEMPTPTHQIISEPTMVDNTSRYYTNPKEDRIQPIVIESKEKLLEAYKGVYTEKEIDVMITRAQMINAVDKFTGSI